MADPAANEASQRCPVVGQVNIITHPQSSATTDNNNTTTTHGNDHTTRMFLHTELSPYR